MLCYRFQQLSPFEVEDLTSSSEEEVGAVSISIPGKAKKSSSSSKQSSASDLSDEWYRFCHVCMRCKCGLKPRFENASYPGFYKHHKLLGECTCKNWTMTFFQTPLTSEEAKKLFQRREKLKRKRKEENTSESAKKQHFHEEVFLMGYNRVPNPDYSSSDES